MHHGSHHALWTAAQSCDWSQSSLSHNALGPWTLARDLPDLHIQEGRELEPTCVSQSSTSATLAETHSVSRGVAQPASLARTDDRSFRGAIRLNHLRVLDSKEVSDDSRVSSHGLGVGTE